MNIQALQNHASLGVQQQPSQHTKSQPIDSRKASREDKTNTAIGVEAIDETPKMGSCTVESAVHPDRVDTETMSDQNKKYEIDQYDDQAVIVKHGTETRAHSSSFAKRPLVATALSNKMLHTVSTNMAAGVDFISNEPLAAQMHSSNALDFANKTQFMNPVQSGQ